MYPIDWSESDVVAEHAVLVLHRNDESFTVLAQPVRETDLNAMERRAVEKYRGQFDKFELIESLAARLGGVPARRIVCRGSTRGGSGGPGQEFELLNTLAVYRGQGYAAIYAASPATFEKGRADASGSSIQCSLRSEIDSPMNWNLSSNRACVVVFVLMACAVTATPLTHLQKRHAVRQRRTGLSAQLSLEMASHQSSKDRQRRTDAEPRRGRHQNAFFHSLFSRQWRRKAGIQRANRAVLVGAAQTSG